jgi:hypothetical protein
MAAGWETSLFCNGLTKYEIEVMCAYLDYAEKWVSYKIQANKDKENEAHWRYELAKIVECESWFRKMRNMK